MEFQSSDKNSSAKIKTTASKKAGGKFERADIIRVPAGLFFIYLSVLGIVKSAEAFEWSPLPAIVSAFGIAVSLLFALLGVVMSAGPFAGRVNCSYKKLRDDG